MVPVLANTSSEPVPTIWFISPALLYAANPGGYEVLKGLWVYRYFTIGILARRATAHLAQLADQHESHQAASQAFRKVPSLGLWPVTSGLKVSFGYFLGGAANARRVVKNGFIGMFWRRVERAMVANRSVSLKPSNATTHGASWMSKRQIVRQTC